MDEPNKTKTVSDAESWRLEQATADISDMDNGKTWWFKNGTFESAPFPFGLEWDNDDEDLAAAGYRPLCSFMNPETGFGFGIKHRGDNYLVEIDYRDTIQSIFIDSFPDYMEFLRRFAHLGTLAETSATRYYIERAHEVALDPDSGMLREQLREVARANKAIRDRYEAMRLQTHQPKP